MTSIDTSTEAVERLLEGVTRGPWRIKDCDTLGDRCTNYFQEIWNDETDILVTTEVTRAHNDGGAKNMRFIRAARDLVPALLKERDEARARAAAAFDVAVVHLRNWQDDLIATGYPDMGVAVGMAADVLADLATKAERDALAKIRAEAMREAADVCAGIRTQIANGPMPEGARFDYEQSILARADQIEKGETK